MLDLLAQEQREVLAQLGWARTLVAFDYDGTLAPIVEHHEDAPMRDETRRLLREVALRYPVAVISGRSQADAMRWLEGVAVRVVVGNHGLEPWTSTDTLARSVARWRPHLEEALAGAEGVAIEDKLLSLAVHYRQAPDEGAAVETIRRACARLPGVRLLPGKRVINVLPEGAPHKGTALVRLRGLLDCDTALYTGDDITDEDVFRLDEPGRLVTVRVGPSEVSSASYFIHDQSSVDDLLRALLDARPSADDVRREHHELFP